MKLSTLQQQNIEFMVRRGGMTAHHEDRSMLALKKKGLVELQEPYHLGSWVLTNKAKELFTK